MSQNQECLVPDDLIRNMLLENRIWHIAQQNGSLIRFGMNTQETQDLNQALTVVRTKRALTTTRNPQQAQITITGIGFDTHGEERIISARYIKTIKYVLDALRVSLTEPQRAHLSLEDGPYNPLYDDLDITQGMIDTITANGQPHTRLVQAYRAREFAPISIFGEPDNRYQDVQYGFRQNNTSAFIVSPYGWQIYVPTSLESAKM